MSCQRNTTPTFDARTTANFDSPFVGIPLLFIGIYSNTDVNEEDYRWSFIVYPAKKEGASEEQEYLLLWRLGHGRGNRCRFEAHQGRLRDQENMLGWLVIAEVKNLKELDDTLLSSSPSTSVPDNRKSRSLFWVQGMLERLVDAGCLKGKPKAFEDIETAGREIAQRHTQLGKTMYVPQDNGLLDRRPSQGAETGKETEAVVEGKEKNAILQSQQIHSAPSIDDRASHVRSNHPATSSTGKTVTNLVPEYNTDSDSDAEDNSRDVVEVHRPSSSVGPPSIPSPAGPPSTPPTSMGPPSKPASSMSPPKLPVSATRGKRKHPAGRDAGTEAPAPGRKYFTMDDLPLVRYDKKGHRVW